MPGLPRLPGSIARYCPTAGFSQAVDHRESAGRDRSKKALPGARLYVLERFSLDDHNLGEVTAASVVRWAVSRPSQLGVRKTV
jgi:hypothetical protein